jgi:hypothetical protein
VKSVAAIDVFTNPGGVPEGIEKINATAELLFTQFEGDVFAARGQDSLCIASGRLPWSYGPPMTLRG